MTNADAVFFISFGGPEKREDIMPFLEIVTRGRGIPKERLLDVAHHYEVIGGKSPINDITRSQASALSAQLKADGFPLPVYIGNRNWHPFIEDALRQMAAAGVKRAVGFVTAAYRCEASWERYLNAIEEARRRIGPLAPAMEYVDPWFDHPLFIEAIAARIEEAFAPPLANSCPLSWIFTAHSIPMPVAESSRYVQELEKTAELVCKRLGQKEWTLAYTSRSGRPTDPWLEPDLCDVIAGQAQKEVRDIFLIPIGFIADHVEILFDLDVEAKEAAQKAGVRLSRAKSVGDHPLFVRMMSEVVRARRSQPVK